MKTEKRVLVVVLVILLALAAGYSFLAADEEAAPAITGNIARTAPPPAPPSPVQPPAPAVESEPAVLHPIEPETPEEPLPEPEESDAVFGKALREALGQKGSRLMLSEELIHHIVVCVDNLPRKHLPASIVPLRRAEGAFVVEGKDETLAIGAGNAKRYAAFIAAARAADSDRLAGLYRRYYPLFQRAYQEIGYPKGHFNDRLVTAIDDLLAAPVPAAPVRLGQPRVLFEYADPKLENRSAGQKIMMRIGQENAAALKAKLREIRSRIAK